MAATATDDPAAPAPVMDWREVVAALRGSDEWAQLMGDLAGVPGGPSVAALLRLGATRAAAASPGSDAASSAGGAAGGGWERLAEAVQQVAWEKLHTGDWHAVAVAWRDAYAAACILAAAAGRPARQEGQQAAPAAPAAGAGAAAGAGPGPGQRAGQQGEASALAAALWHLDMAAIMGGPLLRPLVDALIEELQQSWQALHGRPAAGAAAGTTSAQVQGQAEQQVKQQVGGEAGGEQAGEQPAAKRARTADGEAAPHGAAPAAAAAATEDAALLPPWSLGPRGSPVAAAELPSLEAFWRDYMSQGTPVVISGAMADWPALSRWADPGYLIRVAGPRTVPVEVGEHYLSDRWGQQLMTLQRFVEAHVLGAACAAGQQRAARQGEPAPAPAASATAAGDASLDQQQQQQRRRRHQEQEQGVQEAQQHQHQHHQEQQQQEQEAQEQQEGQGVQEQPRGYLAQHPLFDQIPALAADIREPPYCCLGEGEVQSVNAWYGPAGTVTPLHTDPHPNLLCQAVGRKYVRLYPPSAAPAMYPHAQGMHTNSGRVDVDRPDLRRFPLFDQAAFQDCVLEAGQMLFIPAGWWHYVKSTTVSFSVSFWWR